MKRYFLHLAYNGKAYHGWQVQPGDTTVQGVLEHCLSLKLKQPVNARNFYAHFDSEPIADAAELVHRLNVFLPNDITVFSCWQVAPDFHARFDALSRTYHFRLSTMLL